MQSDEIEALLDTIQKFTKWIIDLNGRNKTLKLLEENRG